jgi:hypothetical protein
MLSTTFKSRPVGQILRHIILGGGITLISLGSRINPPPIKGEHHIIPQDFLLTKIKDAQLLPASSSSCQAPTQAPASSTQSLEETMREFKKMTGQSISDVRQSTMVNTQALLKLEMQMG